MSGPELAAPFVATTPSLKRKHRSSAEQAELDSLDNIFKRIRTAVPRTPYILSTPSLHPYRYHSQQEANAWILGRLWRPGEEHMQYRTYLYREPCQDCFELQAGEDDEPEPEQPKSQASNGQKTKKKMNLSAFKVKPANGAVTPGVKISSRDAAPAKHTPEQSNGVTKSEKLSAPSQTQPQARSLSQKSESVGSKASNDKSDVSNATPHGLPPLLSPVDEPVGNPYGFPTILSPTLPVNVQAELDRLEVQRTRLQKPDGTPKSENRIRSVSVNGKPPHPPPASSAEQADSNLVVKLKFSKTKADTVKQILRLPAKRAMGEKKETPKHTSTDAPKLADAPIIKKKPIPKVAARRGGTTTPAPASTTNTRTKPAAASNKVGEKRPRTDDDASLALSSKRPRASSTLDRPMTPAQQISSPALSNKSSTQKSQTQYATPKKDLKAVSMLRTNSSESYDATPGRSGATPAGVKAEHKAGPTSAPLNSKKQADISLLGQTSAKLNQMGRALKHEATKILITAGNKITKQDEKRAAVTNLECILAYMVAYYAQDVSLNLRGRPGEVEQTWKTLLPLCLSYARCTKDLPHLDGLRSYLGSVIASAICTHVSQRGPPVVPTKPHDSPQDFSLADLAKQHNAMTENFALLADHTIKMNRHYQDARMALPMDEVQTRYPKTYAARETNMVLAREPEKISGARMSGPYFLPLSTDTTPIQAVRFGLQFLAEYCEKERLDYRVRVRLDRVE
ncbi:hypothetical protein EJ02DRAFT_369613 [Clathrospora elynae]|uniref:Uncharacterized protein n=1 Tax=Clathrospora elynae TaxID=706981 RepID=A0A6A5SZ62_9PLEO|nr:hypothetical protein EJ02DRAFT_369613 [Clathrospora elynae]